MKLHIVVNPNGASGRAWSLWKELEPLFRKSEHEIKLYTSSKEEGITDIVRSITSSPQENYVVVIGGDGTINEAVNGIVDFKRTYFGFIPCGSGNDLAKDLGLSKDAKELVQQILEGKIRRKSDIGEVTVYEGDTSFTRRFNISCGIGYDAEICAYVEQSKAKPFLNKLHLGKLVYLIEGSHVIFTTELTPMKLYYNNEMRYVDKALFVVGMNHAYEGGGFKFCPNASDQDRKLDICIAENLSRFDFFRIFPYAYNGNHVKFKGVHLDQVEDIDIQSEKPLYVHTDGEVVGQYSHISMRILEDQLQLIL